MPCWAEVAEVAEGETGLSGESVMSEERMLVLPRTQWQIYQGRDLRAQEALQQAEAP